LFTWSAEARQCSKKNKPEIITVISGPINLSFERDTTMMSQSINSGKFFSASYISRSQAAKLLKVSPRMADKLIAAHQIPVFQIPGHSRKLVDRAGLMALVERAKVGGGA
jgi:hypothetical protein